MEKPSTKIEDFWRANPSYWIPISKKQKQLADTVIHKKFFDIDYAKESFLGQVIYFDQFLRHFQRKGVKVEDSLITMHRESICIEILNEIDSLTYVDEFTLVFLLMPLKHCQRFETIMKVVFEMWLPVQTSQKLIDHPILHKFTTDACTKYYTLDTIKQNLIVDGHPMPPYEPHPLCDFHPSEYNEDDWATKIRERFDSIQDKSTLETLRKTWDGKPVIVSLSGGVDSMVMICLFKLLEIPVTAAHLIYGNRPTSQEEYHFLARYCHKIGVDLNVYKVPHIRKGEVDRGFYESFTRDQRFWLYQAINPDATVYLGHIIDDVVENIWTNFANAQHLDDLKKMTIHDNQKGVKICRPFLNTQKKNIYAISEAVGIPYLKNTTPRWCNRGKFREQFYEQTHIQYGEHVDQSVIKVAEILTRQSQMLDRLIYDPILASFRDNEVDITRAVDAELDQNGWLRIFEKICHEKMGIARPSIHAIDELIVRLAKAKKKDTSHLKVQMKSGIQLIITKKLSVWTMKICLV